MTDTPCSQLNETWPAHCCHKSGALTLAGGNLDGDDLVVADFRCPGLGRELVGADGERVLVLAVDDVLVIVGPG